MVLKHDGIIMAKDIIEFPEGTDGFDLTDKSEKITDTEIFFNNADDSVVHVEVDGKSYQHAGSGKNLFSVPYPDALKDFIRPLDYWVKPITLKANTQYTISSKLTGNLIEGTTVMVWNGGDWYADRGTDHYVLLADGAERTSRFNTGDVIDWKIAIFLTSDLESSKELLGELLDNYQFQLEEGSIATEYEPPAPTPDNPIEIHSLNDFDVVSSVGRRNLLVGRESGNYRLNSNDNTTVPMIYKSYEDYDSVMLTAGYQLSTYSQGMFTLEKGKEYIFSMYVYSPVRLDLSIIRYYGDVWTTVPANTWTRLSKTVVGIGERQRIGSLFSRNDEALNHEIFYNRIKLEEGESSRYSPAPEDITEDSNHPLIDKINLLLDEPLRSVGDVKDRLFRDSDGLWKVERKVGEYSFNGTETWSFMPNEIGNSLTGFQYDHKFLGMDTGSQSISNKLVYKDFDIATRNRISRTDVTAGIFSTGIGLNQVKIIIDSSILATNDVDGFKNLLRDWYNSNNPLTITYILRDFTIEALPQSLQDKLNNLRSFQDSNYVYTVVDKTDILSDYVIDNLKPTLHARFKSEDYGILNNDYGINYPDKITYLGTYFKHGDLVTQEFIESED